MDIARFYSSPGSDELRQGARQLFTLQVLLEARGDQGDLQRCLGA
jgi:hypothetical protein